MILRGVGLGLGHAINDCPRIDALDFCGVGGVAKVKVEVIHGVASRFVVHRVGVMVGGGVGVGAPLVYVACSIRMVGWEVDDGVHG